MFVGIAAIPDIMHKIALSLPLMQIMEDVDEGTGAMEAGEDVTEDADMVVAGAGTMIPSTIARRTQGSNHQVRTIQESARWAT